MGNLTLPAEGSLGDIERECSQGRLAWAAGFLDGEGCIAITKKGVTYGLVVTIAQNVQEPLDWFGDLFGGSVRLGCGTTTGTMHFQWAITGQRAERMLRRVLPWLTVKREQAQLGIQFQSRRHALVGQRTNANKDHDIADWHEMKRLKKSRNING